MAALQRAVGILKKKVLVSFYLTAYFSNLLDYRLFPCMNKQMTTHCYTRIPQYTVWKLLDDAIFSFSNSKFFIFQNFYLFIYCLLHWVFKDVRKLPLTVVMSRPYSHGLLTAWASVFAEHGLQTQLALIFEARGFGCTMVRGTFPDWGIEPMYPALIGGFLTTVPPEKSLLFIFPKRIIPVHSCPGK